MSFKQIEGWFTEEYAGQGSAFSLKINAVLHEEQTPYQHIAIYATETFGNLMVIDGCVMLTSRDNFLYHEMMSHPVLFTHVDPKEVVIIGGGDCGTLREVLRHDSVVRATQVDIDERVTRLAEEYFPELCESNHDPRAKLCFDDGIAWMQQAPAESIDVIIIDSTDPIGPAEGLFGEPFFRSCLQALRPNGIFIQQSESPLYHCDTIIKPMHDTLRAAGFSQTQSLLFPQPCYPSGWWSATMASKGCELTQFRQEKKFVTQYYNAAIHQAALAVPEFFLGSFSLNLTF